MAMKKLEFRHFGYYNFCVTIYDMCKDLVHLCEPDEWKDEEIKEHIDDLYELLDLDKEFARVRKKMIDGYAAEVNKISYLYKSDSSFGGEGGSATIKYYAWITCPINRYWFGAKC